MKNIEALKLVKELQKESIEFKDIFGIHKGVIHELKVKDNGIFAYGIFFGKNLWLRLNENTMKWEPIGR